MLFIKAFVANSIWDKKEYSSLNKMERAVTDEMIKEICIPVKVDRLGNASLIKYNAMIKKTLYFGNPAYLSLQIISWSLSYRRWSVTLHFQKALSLNRL